MRVTLSFHGARDDIYSMVCPWVAEFQLTLIGEEFFPRYQVTRLEVGEVSRSCDSMGRLNRISLHLGDVDLSADSGLAFVDRNPDGMLITLGSEDVSGLRETLLGAMTDNVPAMRIWKKLRDRARRSMGKGSWIVNKAAGTRVRDDAHLYTSGAKDLQDQGVPILGPSDWILFELG
jgi:hypothetical protein